MPIVWLSPKGLLLLIRRRIIDWTNQLPDPFGPSNLKLESDSASDFFSYFNTKVGRTILVALRSNEEVGGANKRTTMTGCIAILSKNQKAAVLKVTVCAHFVWKLQTNWNDWQLTCVSLYFYFKQHLFVTEKDPSRRRVIARQLIRQAERFCVEHGYHKVELFLPLAATPEEMASNARLFESAGFHIENQTRVFFANWIPVADVIFMAKILEIQWPFPSLPMRLSLGHHI